MITVHGSKAIDMLKIAEPDEWLENDDSQSPEDAEAKAKNAKKAQSEAKKEAEAEAMDEAEAKAALEEEWVIKYILESDAPIDVATYTTMVGGSTRQTQNSSATKNKLVKALKYPAHNLSGTHNFSGTYEVWSFGVSGMAGPYAGTITCKVEMNGRIVDELDLHRPVLNRDVQRRRVRHQLLTAQAPCTLGTHPVHIEHKKGDSG
jgi:hypothetical protein